MPKPKRAPKKKLLTPEQLAELDHGLAAGTMKSNELDLPTVIASMEAEAKKRGGLKKVMRTLPSNVLAVALRGMASVTERQATTRLTKRGVKFPIAMLREAALRLEFAGLPT